MTPLRDLLASLLDHCEAMVDATEAQDWDGVAALDTERLALLKEIERSKDDGTSSQFQSIKQRILDLDYRIMQKVTAALERFHDEFHSAQGNLEGLRAYSAQMGG